MPKVHPIQNSFAAGELSPRLYGRTDTERYREGLITLENFISLAHGPARFRPGFKRVANAKVSTGLVRLIDFDLNILESYQLEIGQSYMRLYNRSGQIKQEHLNATPYFQTGITGWTDSSSGNGKIEWVRKNQSMRFVPGTGTAKASQSFTINTTSTAHTLYLRVKVDEANGGKPLNVKIGTALDDDTYLASTDLTQGDYALAFTPTATPAVITLTVANTADEVVEVDYVVAIEDANDAALEWATNWNTDTKIEELQYTINLTGREILFTERQNGIARLAYAGAGEDLNAGQWTFNGAYHSSFTSAPGVWGAGNYPRAIAVHQQRLWVAGTPQQPDTLWASKIGAVTDFSVSTPVVDTDAIVGYTMSDRGGIVWLQSEKNLLCGTQVGEYIIEGSESNIIAPGKISNEKQSAYGSSLHQALPLGNGAVYVDPTERRVRFMSYRFLDDGWKSLDITWPSEHMSAGDIRWQSYKPFPDSFLCFCDRLGQLFICTYEVELESVGWHRHPISDEIMSIASNRSLDESIVWAVIKRSNSGGVYYSIEKMAVWDDQIHMDNSMECVSDVLTNTVTGLDHLEGETVAVTVDGAVHPAVTVASGTITLQETGYKFIVGVPYSGTLKTLPLEGGNPSGSSQTIMRRWNQIYLRLRQSGYPLINGERPESRSVTTLLGDAEPLFTGDVRVGDMGRDRAAQVEVVQDLPQPCEVQAIMGELYGSNV